MIDVKSETSFETFIYYLRHDNLTLQIDNKIFPDKILNLLIKRNGVLIWEAQGAFKLIPAPILCNLILNYNASQQLKKEYPRTKEPDGFTTIVWNQGISLSPAAADVLLLAACKERYELCEPDTTTDPTTEGKSDQ